jgi:hypothetical protein
MRSFGIEAKAKEMNHYRPTYAGANVGHPSGLHSGRFTSWLRLLGFRCAGWRGTLWARLERFSQKRIEF